jgi:D-alanyl-D-alanine carboxypeptidase
LSLLFKDKQKSLDPKSYFDNLNIQGKSYIVYNAKDQSIIYSKNENEVLPLASLTKVISAITANKLTDKNTKITIRKSLMRKDESLDIGMKEGQAWKMNDLLKYALTISSNSSMDIIAGTVSKTNSNFVDNMNNYTKDLGYKNFYFNSASGLDYGDVIGGEGSALEYAKLFAKSYELIPDIMSYTINSKVNLNSNSQKIYQVPNTNKSASEIIGLMASKTGFTDAAGGNLAVLYEPEINKPIIIVVLGSTYDARFDDVKKLLDATNRFLQDSSN